MLHLNKNQQKFKNKKKISKRYLINLINKRFNYNNQYNLNNKMSKKQNNKKITINIIIYNNIFKYKSIIILQISSSKLKQMKIKQIRNIILIVNKISKQE